MWTIFGPRFIYCFLCVIVVSNFCHRESKSEFVDIRRNFRTKALEVKLILPLVFWFLPFAKLTKRSFVFPASVAAVKSSRS